MSYKKKVLEAPELSADTRVLVEDLINKFKDAYMKNIQNNALYPISEELKEEIMLHINDVYTYLEEKIGAKQKLQDPNFTFGTGSKNRWRSIRLNTFLVYLKQYVYFGIVPMWLSDAELESQRLKLNYNFIWRKEDDADIHSPPLDVLITNDNFFDYRSNNTQGWSKNQLVTYFETNIVPDWNALGAHINPESKVFRRLVKNGLKRSTLKKMVSHYINDKDTELQLYKTIIDAEPCNDDDVDNTGTHHTWLYLLLCYLHTFRTNLKQKLLKAVEKSSTTNRFKWSNLCQPDKLGQRFDMDELRELASLEGIPLFLFLTKRELCAELSKRFQTVIEQKLKVQSRCTNTTSILGDELNDIPPEFFYAYEHNNKVYCDDIRYLKQQFDTNRKNPYDNLPVSTEVVTQVNEWYDHLTRVTNTMEDLFVSPQVQGTSEKSVLSSKAAELGNLLNYVNITLFLESNKETVDRFVHTLFDEEILTNNELYSLNATGGDLVKYKTQIVELLITKIKHELHNGAAYSSIAINTSVVFREIF